MRTKSLIADLLCIDEQLAMHDYNIHSPNRKTIAEAIDVLQQSLNKQDELLCVFCGEECSEAPTKRGWIGAGLGKRLHFDCARKVVSVADSVDRAEHSTD